MLNNFRSHSHGLAAKILLGFLVLTFALWGIGDMVQPAGRNAPVANVGSITITAGEYQQVLRQEVDNVRSVLGDRYSPEMLASLNLPQQVLQNMIDRALIRLEARALGLIPGDAIIVQRIRSNPMFQDKKGAFDKGLFEAKLRALGASEKAYVNQMRQDIAMGLLIESMLTVTPVSDTAVRTLLAAREEQRTATLYSLDSSLVQEIAAPNDAQLKAYYDSHLTEFTAPEYRAVSYLTLTSDDVQKNAGTSEADLRAAYKERIDEFKRSERRTVEQLLYDSEEKAKQAEALLKEGKSFAQVAKDTGVMNKDSISLGKVERNNIMENAAEAVFSLKAGEDTPPISSPFGWHIFHVTAIDKPATATFEEVRPILEKDLKQHGADDALNKLANKLDDALAGGSTLTEAASQLGLKVRSLGPVNRQGLSPDGSKARLPELEKFLDVAFKTDEKTESPLTTSKGGAYYILRTDSVTPERARPLADVKSQVVSGWQKEQREKRLNELTLDIAAKFSDPATREAVLEKYNMNPTASATVKRNSQTADGIALPPLLVAEIFAHTPKEGTQSYLSKKGDYLMAVVDSVIPASTPEKDPALKKTMAEIREGLEASERNEILSQYTSYLARKYPVSIHESVVQAATR